jgi:hypothetical protein
MKLLALALAASLTHAQSAPSTGMHDPKEDAQVTRFLASIDLAEYAPAFAEHKVDYETLRALTSQQLKEIGVRAVGASAKITNKLRQQQARLRVHGAKASAPCPGSNPSQYTLPMGFTLLVADTGSLYEGRSAISSATRCQYIDINGDGLPDISCSLEDIDSGASVSAACVYMNTNCGWILSNQYNKTQNYCPPGN